MKKIISLILIFSTLAFCFCGCRESDRVSYNMSKEADNFNVTRRLVVVNARTDALILEIVGNFSVSNNEENELEVVVETGENQYKKHFVYLNKFTIYTIEDISGANVEKYQYEINYLPQMIKPFKITNNK